MKRAASFLLALILLLSCLAFPVSAEEAAFDADASAALLIELNTHTVLYEKNADTQIYPASLTKVMTCMLALKYGTLSDIVTASSEALSNIDPDGSTADLQPGEQMSLENLCYCIMVSSANDACNVVAEYISGSIENFVALMNQTASELGCSSTHFANPNGLHDDDHYTTARDLAIITEAALQDETFAKMCNTVTYTVPATNKSDERTLTTSNYLINPAVTNTYYYAKASGVKTGYTSKAGRCLISTASNGSLKLLGIVCGCDTTILDNGNVIQQSFVQMADMFDYGFASYNYVTVLDTLTSMCEVPVTLSAGTDAVVAVPAESISALLPADYDPDDCIYSIDLKYSDSIEAPVSKGDVLGTVTVSWKGTILGSTDLLALSDVKRSDFAYAVKLIRLLFFHYWWAVLLVILFICLVSFGIRRRHRRTRKESR